MLGRIYLKDNSAENKQAFLDALYEIPDVHYIDQLIPELSEKELALVSQKLDIDISKNYKALCNFSKLNDDYLDWSTAEYFVENGEFDYLDHFITFNEAQTEILCLLCSVVTMGSAALLDDASEIERFESLLAKYPVLKADKMLLTDDARYSDADGEEFFLWSNDIDYIVNTYNFRENEIVESFSQTVKSAGIDEETYIQSVDAISEKIGVDSEPLDIF